MERYQEQLPAIEITDLQITGASGLSSFREEFLLLNEQLQACVLRDWLNDQELTLQVQIVLEISPRGAIAGLLVGEPQPVSFGDTLGGETQYKSRTEQCITERIRRWPVSEINHGREIDTKYIIIWFPS